MRSTGTKRFVQRSMVAAAVLLTGIGMAAPANARVGHLSDYYGRGINIRTGPGTGYTSVGLGYEGQGACVFYTVKGDPYKQVPYWVNHANMSTSASGYSHILFLSTIAWEGECAVI